MATTEERVREIIVELLDVDAEKVTLDARFREDLEADSLDLVELIMKIEEEFGGDISDEEAQKITTVGEAVSYIETRMKGAQAVAAQALRSPEYRSFQRARLSQILFAVSAGRLSRSRQGRADAQQLPLTACCVLSIVGDAHALPAACARFSR
jgi:acyl carrier protein